MHILLGSSNNIYPNPTFNASEKTLTFTDIIEFDLGLSSIVSVWDDTTGAYFNLQGTLYSNTPANGVPVWTVTFPQIPAEAADGDTLVIILNVPDNNAIYSILQQIAGATA